MSQNKYYICNHCFEKYIGAESTSNDFQVFCSIECENAERAMFETNGSMVDDVLQKMGTMDKKL